MGLLTNLFGKFTGTAVDPWASPSAYEVIRAAIDPSSGRLATAAVQLPDEVPETGSDHIRWAPGAMDGVMGHHGSSSKSEAAVTRLARLIGQIAQNGDRRAVAATYAMLKEDSVLGLIDPLLEKLQQNGTPVAPHLERFAVQLATQSADRGPVKIGIALLGAARLAQHREIVETLGVHDEFTLFSAVALSNMLDDAEHPLWQLASRVDGWGRIQIVERMVPVRSDAVRHWLRTEGFRNSVMYEYLALIAAEQGQLRAALDQPSVPHAELLAAGKIITSMIVADGIGPCEGMNSYEDAAATSLLYLQHVSHAPADLEHYLAVHMLLEYMESDERPVAERLSQGWSGSAVSHAQGLARDIIDRDVWRKLIHERLEVDDREIFYRAAQAARQAGIDAFPWHWQRLQRYPLESMSWLSIMDCVNSERIGAVVEFAQRVLPLDQIATGPAHVAGMGKAFALHRCLGAVLQSLNAFPGHGARLIATGLHSPVISDRRMAINVLEAWPTDTWTDELRQAVERAKEAEVHEDVAKRLNELSPASKQ